MHALVCSLLLLAAPAEPSPPDVIVVAADDLMPALRPWFAHRQSQGHVIGHLSNTLPKAELRDSIRESAKSGRLKAVLIVGDGAVDANDNRAARARLVPMHYEAAKVNILFGGEEKTIPTDNYFADLDDDNIPDLAVGRLPADDPDDVSRMVSKIIAFERSAPAEWRQRINFIAGVGGFGPLIDNVLEMSTRKFLCDGIPSSYTTNMTYGSWRSPFCPDPRRFHEAALERMNEGSLFWVYIGHGQKTELDRVSVPGRHYHILAGADANKCRCEAGNPIAIFLACYTGAFDQPEDCLAEEFLRKEHGPVAVLSGSRVTMPYAMAVLGTNMMDEYFQERRETLGEIVLNSKRRMMIDDGKNSNRALLDAIAQAISPAKDKLADERQEHLYLFNLLGDPLLRLKHNDTIDVTSPNSATGGDEIEVTAKSPIAGACKVELICRRDQLRFTAPKRELYLNAESFLGGLDETYAAANDRCWTAAEAKIPAGAFSTKLAIPAECRGFCHVRVTVTGEKSYALGASNVYVHALKTAKR